MENEMNKDVTVVIPDASDRVKIISWGSVFAGVVIALVLQLLLSLLGVAIGMGTVHPMSEAQPLEGIGTGALIWWGLSVLISLFAGGWVAGRWTGMRLHGGGFHGLLTWGIFTLLSLFLVTSVVGNVISGIGKTLAFAGQTAAQVAPEASDAIRGQMQQEGITADDIKQEARELLQQSGNQGLYSENRSTTTTTGGNQVRDKAEDILSNPDQAQEKLNQTIDSLFGKGNEIVDRESAINIIVARTGKSREEAAAIVDGWSRNFQQMRQQAESKAREVGEDAAKGMSRVATFTLLALILGAGVSALGGRLGEKQIRKNAYVVRNP